MREALFTSDNWLEASQQLLPSNAAAPVLRHVLSNCHLLATMYPPFGPERLLHQRQALERLILPFTKGVFKKLKEFVNRMQRTGTILEEERSSILSVEHCPIDYDDGLDAEGRPIASNCSRDIKPVTSSLIGTKTSGKKSILGRLMDRMKI
jgi:hypothetical protein